MKSLSLLMLVMLFSMEALSQDSVDVTFRYKALYPSTWRVAGEFTSWAAGADSMSTTDNITYVATIRLTSSGQPGGFTPGGYEYKFTNLTLIGNGQPWPNDPLNPRTDGGQNGNSILYVRNPTIYQFIPNQVTGVVRTSTPTISAYIFPKVGTTFDPGSISVKVDSVVYNNLGKWYNVSTQQFSFKLPSPLDNGIRKIYLTAGGNSDSVTITVQAGAVQITNLGNFTTLNPVRTLYGIVEDTLISAVRVVRNNIDTMITSATSGQYSIDVSLLEGINTFKAIITDSSGFPQVSSPVTFTLSVNHAPDAEVSYVDNGTSIQVSGSQSTDPDLGQTALLKYQWLSDTANPQSISSLDAAISRDVPISKPTKPGDYFVRLIVTDSTGNKDTTRSFFTILNDGSFRASTLASVPGWAKNGRIYSFFFNGLTGADAGQRINAAVSFLPYIKAMGFDILWVLPVMRVYLGMDNFAGIGYNIVDFENVDPGYGTNDDFKNFVQQAHALGLKVILDVTPNHTSFDHPFVHEARQFRLNSPHWNFYLHSNTDYNSNGLGVSMTNDGFQYFGGFSDQLLNYNWADIDARTYMINVYKHWVQQFGIDGYRFDVYWGPHNRANNLTGGENEMGVPVRRALKHIKPDIWLLGETAGTGGGTEVNYADQGGGVDAAYDWTLKDAVHGLYPNGFSSFANSITDGGYFPGPNSSYLRFLENQDEERIVYVYQQYEDTKPPATVIFTSPGMPMIWEGQELGIGTLVSSGDRRRAVVNWAQSDFHNLRPFYQRLAQIRAQFPAFSTQQMQVLPAPANVFAFIRPYKGESGIVATNFNDTAVTVALSLSKGSLDSTLEDGVPYALSDVFHDSVTTITFVGGMSTVNLRLPFYGSAVFVLADTGRHVVLPTVPTITGVESGNRAGQTPKQFQLNYNYPNPFNPSTTLSFDIPQPGNVTLKIYNLLGQEVAVLLNGYQPAGRHSVVWNGMGSLGNQAGSGVYFARLQQASQVQVRKLVLLR